MDPWSDPAQSYGFSSQVDSSKASRALRGAGSCSSQSNMARRKAGEAVLQLETNALCPGFILNP